MLLCINSESHLYLWFHKLSSDTNKICTENLFVLLSVASKWNVKIEICLLRLILSLCLSVGVFACSLFSSYWCYFNKMRGATFSPYTSIKGERLPVENDTCYKQWSPQCHARPRSDPHFQAVATPLPITIPRSWHLNVWTCACIVHLIREHF